MYEKENYVTDEISESIIIDKSIELLASLVNGKDVEVLLNENIDFFLDLSGADIIAIYLNDDDMVQPEYIFEQNNLFKDLLQKYMFDRKKFTWDKFIKNFNAYFSTQLEYYKLTSFNNIFKGVIPEKEIDIFTDELHMKNMIFVPLYAIDKRVKMGYISFIFQSDKAVDSVNIQEMSLMFQIVLQPLYDSVTNTMYTKCIRIDGVMKILTDQEKRVVEKVLGGYTYVDIAASLGVSINTIKTHMKNIFNKCNVNSKIELFHKFSAYK